MVSQIYPTWHFVKKIIRQKCNSSKKSWAISRNLTNNPLYFDELTYRNLKPVLAKISFIEILVKENIPNVNIFRPDCFDRIVDDTILPAIGYYIESCKCYFDICKMQENALKGTGDKAQWNNGIMNYMHTCIKRSSYTITNYSDATMNTIHEAKLLSKFDHENIPRLSGMFIQFNRVSACLEQFDGVCMHILLQRNSSKIDPHRLSIIIQICTVANYLNSLGYLIRNFHLGNFFFLRGDNKVMVKLCNMIDVTCKRKHAVPLVGKVTRLPPESREINNFSIQSEVWSIGWMALTIWTKNINFERVTKIRIENFRIDNTDNFFNLLYNTMKIVPKLRPCMLKVLNDLRSLENNSNWYAKFL